VSSGLNDRWKVYPDPDLLPAGWFYVGEKVVWSGGKKRRTCVGVVESHQWGRDDRTLKFYVVAVLNRRHGQQHAVKLRPHQLTRATIVDEIAALAFKEA
jgi:hypothetical protein